MPELWENPFANAHLKVERANKHIADIEERLRTSSNRYGPGLHIDGQSGEQHLHYRLTDRELRRDIALIVGDAIHNLRCALDMAWNGTVRSVAANPPSDYCKLPVYPKDGREALKSALTKSTKIPEPSPVLSFMLDVVQCYRGGDSDILAIHALDIDDKHRVLIHMLTVTGLSGVEVQHEDGTVTRYEIMLVPPNSYDAVIPLNSKLKNHGEVRFEITFGEGASTQGLEVLPTLRRFSTKTERIVRRLQVLALQGRHVNS
jgi:hypothetical protein